MTVFKAIVVDKKDGVLEARYRDFNEDDLLDGNVTVRVEWSSLNYKDGLALTGRAQVVRLFPMIPGIDFAGVVERSAHPAWNPGDKVILTGFGAGEVHPGGYGEIARVNGDWLVALPTGITARESMSIGTAGFTAMLAVRALEQHGLSPEAGPVVVTGAAGGVGSIAVAILAKRGYHVIACTGRAVLTDYLRGLGAAEVIDRKELSGSPKALAKERWTGGVDSVGSATLANVLSMTKYGGAVAACGLAGGMDLPVTVAPFILRGVTLCGIDSVQFPQRQRQEVWQQLGENLDRQKLALMTTQIDLADVLNDAGAILDGRVQGRTVIRIRE